jgi:hypothetical protein
MTGGNSDLLEFSGENLQTKFTKKRVAPFLFYSSIVQGLNFHLIAYTYEAISRVLGRISRVLGRISRVLGG